MAKKSNQKEKRKRLNAEDKHALIDVIQWYQKNYHKLPLSDYTELINNIKEVTTPCQLESYWKVVDEWFN